MDQLILYQLPTFAALPRPDGSWIIHSGWGGSRQVLAVLADDAALIQFLRSNHDTARATLEPLFKKRAPVLDLDTISFGEKK